MRQLAQVSRVPDQIGWSGDGPLPNPQLEQVARDLFAFKYPLTSYENTFCVEERNECRRFALRMKAACMTLERVTSQDTDTPDWQMPPNTDIREAQWRDAFFAAQLANVTCLHIWGVPLLRVKPQVRIDVRSFADTYTEDAIERYASILNVSEGK